MLTRLGISAFLSMTVMMFSMYLYRQQFVDPTSVTPVSEQLAGVMRYLCLLFATPVFFMLGWPILAAAIESAKSRVYSTDALVVLGVAAAFIYSYMSTLRDRGPVYYETGCVVLVFMTLGRWLEASGKLKASSAVASLDSLLPSDVSINREGQTLTVRPQDIQFGDLLSVFPGQRIAADGRVESGRAHVDEGVVSGEAAPITREPGDIVRAGTLNLDGALEIRASSVGATSTLGRLNALLEAAKASKSRLERMTDHLSRIFIPITILLALAGLVVGSMRSGLDQGIMSALAVLLIACPCALGIATPMAIWVALGQAARRGILFRGGEHLEEFARVRAVCFDKTGTLTSGEPAVVALTVDLDSGADESRVLSIASGLARSSNHILSRGIENMAASRGVSSAAIRESRTRPGRGVAGRCNGMDVALGSLTLMEGAGCAVGEKSAQAIDRIRRNGNPFACIGWDGAVQGVFEFSEILRSEASQVMTDLRSAGLKVCVLTGDHTRRAEVLSRELGVKTLGELSPDDKLRHVREVHRLVGSVAMIGDGLNDAPALAAADVGVAMGCGADIARDNAGICLLGNNLSDIPWALALSRRTVHTIRMNLFWAFSYNVVGIGLALVGRLNPIFAAGAMVVSSSIVVTNSLRLTRGCRSAAPRADERSDRSENAMPGDCIASARRGVPA